MEKQSRHFHYSVVWLFLEKVVKMKISSENDCNALRMLHYTTEIPSTSQKDKENDFHLVEFVVINSRMFTTFYCLNWLFVILLLYTFFLGVQVFVSNK